MAGVASSSLSILKKIAYCESRFDPLAINFNKNGSVDFGPLQINSIHKPEMKNMGLHYDDWHDSIDFGIYLFQKNGAAPWHASEFCWFSTEWFFFHSLKKHLVILHLLHSFMDDP